MIEGLPFSTYCYRFCSEERASASARPSRTPSQKRARAFASSATALPPGRVTLLLSRESHRPKRKKISGNRIVGSRPMREPVAPEPKPLPRSGGPLSLSE